MESRKILINSDESKSAQADPAEEPAQFRVIDKRHFVHEDGAASAAGAIEVSPRYPTFVEELMAKLADTERRFKEKVALLDQEASRTRARLEADSELKLSLAKHNLLLPLLDVLDNLERALQAASAGGSNEDLLEGIRMTTELFRTRLKANVIETVDVLGLPFDPNLSQAVGVVPVQDQAQDGCVVEELLRGYRMGDRLLRPAQVRVGQVEREKSTTANS
jgi:molecular chaperone GrpE